MYIKNLRARPRTQSQWIFNSLIFIHPLLVSSYLPRSRPWRSPICSWCASSRQETCTSSSGGYRCWGQRRLHDWSGCCCADWRGWSELLRWGWMLWEWNVKLFICLFFSIFTHFTCWLFYKMSENCEKLNFQYSKVTPWKLLILSDQSQKIFSLGQCETEKPHI